MSGAGFAVGSGSGSESESGLRSRSRCRLAPLLALVLGLATAGGLQAAPREPAIADAERGFAYTLADPTWTVTQSKPGQLTIRPPQGFAATLGVNPNVMGQRLPDF